MTSPDEPIDGQREQSPQRLDAREDEPALAAADQTGSASDQTSSDRDQSAADRDQIAADRDQAASDRGLAHGADPGEHEITRKLRQDTTSEREQTSRVRVRVAGNRDAGADARDRIALARDRAAEARDLAMALDDAVADQDNGTGPVTGAEILLRAAAQRKRAARQRAKAAQQRALAAADRSAAARDRELAARDRRQARADCDALAQQLAISETDPLTGARTRGPGLNDLDHELDRCRRTGASLVAAYVDVVGLKAVNDSEGHAAGDELLARVVTVIRAHLRTYDLIIRLGGDEFLCAMSTMTLPEARRRFDAIAGTLAADPGAGAIRAGFAQLADDETAAQLIKRADGELMDRSRR